MEYVLSDITEEFILANKGKLAWLRDDYLMMRGMATGETLELLNKVVEVKKEYGIRI